MTADEGHRCQEEQRTRPVHYAPDRIEVRIPDRKPEEDPREGETDEERDEIACRDRAFDKPII